MNARDQMEAREALAGAKPPADGLGRERLRALLDNRHKTQTQRREREIRFADLSRSLTAPLLEQRGADAILRELAHKPKREPLAERKKRISADSYIGVPASVTVKGPPYNQILQYASPLPPSSSSSAQADLNGNLHWNIEVYGDAGGVSAGIAVWVFSTIDNPSSRFSALVDAAYRWGDASFVGGTAHNDGSVNLWVWGNSEQDWVSKTASPDVQWSDGTGWNEVHGSNGDGSEVDLSFSFVTYFPAKAANWYQVWLFAMCSCDSYSSIGPASQAFAEFRATVPFVVFEQ
ncbi:MAG TPA: hypothetical protein VH477_17360 [Bryobacteraceae bacterium]